MYYASFLCKWSVIILCGWFGRKAGGWWKLGVSPAHIEELSFFLLSEHLPLIFNIVIIIFAWSLPLYYIAKNSVFHEIHHHRLLSALTDLSVEQCSLATLISKLCKSATSALLSRSSYGAPSDHAWAIHLMDLLFIHRELRNIPHSTWCSKSLWFYTLKVLIMPRLQAAKELHVEMLAVLAN